MTADQRAARACHYCGPTDDELRPYGPGGVGICFPCMKASPDREQAAVGVYGALLDATSAIGLTAIGAEAGPVNVDPDELRDASEGSHRVTLAIVRDDTGERVVVTEADEVIWLGDSLMDEIRGQSADPPMLGAAVIRGDLLTLGTPGEGLGRLTYRLTGRAGDAHAARRERADD